MRVMGDMTMRLGSSSGPTFTGVNSPGCAGISPPPKVPDPYHSLLRADPAIHGKGVAAGVAGLIGQMPHLGVSDLIRLADPPHRDEGGIAVRVATRSLRQERRLHRAGSDRIDPDVLLGVVQRRRL